MVEQLNNIDYLAILPFVLITLHQVRAIIDRDGHTCLLPDLHKCKGKLSVHHIKGKADVPENLITVCNGGAHWRMLHNGASAEEKFRWERELSIIAVNRTQEAIRRGWKF